MAVTNPYYEFTPEFIPGTKARSEDVNVQFQAIQNAFDFLPASSDAITTGTATFAPETGAGNAYVVTMPDTRTIENDGDEVIFFATHTNTGAATLEVDGLGAKSIVRADGNALTANDIQNGLLYVMRYDATNSRYQLVGPSTSYLTDITASEAAAAASAAAALASENAAALSESNAATSEANAAASESLAQEWADKAINSAITGNPGLYSARHWADGAAQAWAINPEDSAIGTTFGGDGATTYSAYHWAQKASATSGLPLPTTAGAMLRVNNAINAFEENTNVLSDPAGIGIAITKVTGAYGLSIDGGNFTNEPVAYFKGNNGTGGILLQTYGGVNANLSIGQYSSGGWLVDTVNGGGLHFSGRGSIGGSGTRAVYQFSADNGAAGVYESVFKVLLNTVNQTILQQWYAGDPTAVEVARIDYDGSFTTVADITAATMRTVTAATGGLEANNTLTGGGFERVLTVSDVFVATTPLELIGDINTATPPTTEAITALLNFVDLAGDDIIGQIGFTASNTMRVTNDMRGGNLVLRGEHAVGGNAAMIVGDPDGAAQIYHPASDVIRAQTNTTGRFNVQSDGNTDTEQRTVNFTHQNGTVRSSIGNVTGDEFILRNLINGGPVQITAVDAGATTRTILDADPDGTTTLRGDTNLILQNAAGEIALQALANADVSLWYDNTYTFSTTGLGEASIYGDANVDADVRLLHFRYANGSDKGYIGHNNSATLSIANLASTSGGVNIAGGDGTTPGNYALLNMNYLAWVADCDALMYFRNAGTNKMEILSTGIICNDGFYINERASAGSDSAGKGQIWVLNDAPNRLMFTDDTGQDHFVAVVGGFAGDNVNVNNSWNFNTAGNYAANLISFHDDGGNDTITLGNSTGTGLTNFPIYSAIQIIAPTSGIITVTEGTGTTLYDETGTDTVGGVTITGGAVTIFRASATNYIIWGTGWT